MKCPECKNSDNIRIYGEKTVKAFLDQNNDVLDSEDISGIEWDDESATECGGCCWEGQVADLIDENDEEEDLEYDEGLDDEEKE